MSVKSGAMSPVFKAAKARYLLTLMAAEADGGDSRRQKLIEAVLADFDRLSS